MKLICETDRLIIRQFNVDDAPFIFRLLNEETFIRYIANKNIRTIDDAKNYLLNGPILSYQKNNFGLNIIQLKDTKVVIGMCGLVNRDELGYPDLGYAFLPEFCGKGYAHEATISVLKSEIVTHDLNTILGVTFPDNFNSNRLLKKLGFIQKGTIELYGSLNNLYEYSTLNKV